MEWGGGGLLVGCASVSVVYGRGRVVVYMLVFRADTGLCICCVSVGYRIAISLSTKHVGTTPPLLWLLVLLIRWTACSESFTQFMPVLDPSRDNLLNVLGNARPKVSPSPCTPSSKIDPPPIPSHFRVLCLSTVDLIFSVGTLQH